MKTLLLQDKGGHQQLEPQTYKITADYGTFLEVKGKYLTMNLTPIGNGEYKNEFGAVYFSVKRDTRPKPYSVRYREEGRGAWAFKKFATLAEIQQYVKDRWQGVEYIDGLADFHTDYCQFVLTGCCLADLGKRKGAPGTDEYWDWEWKDYSQVLSEVI